VTCISRPLSSAGATGNERELFVIELVVFHVGSSARRSHFADDLTLEGARPWRCYLGNRPRCCPHC
jgi:hypothetical protein